MTGPLHQLARLISDRNRLDTEIAKVIGRPAMPGHIGEFIASFVFHIDLESSATNKAWDGRFQDPPLSGRSVNVKFYGKQEGILDIREGAIPDFYLVLTGPKSAAVSSRGSTRPMCIEHVYLFDAPSLVARLQTAGKRLTEATSMTKDLWRASEVYPSSSNSLLQVSDDQRALLRLFANPGGA